MRMVISESGWFGLSEQALLRLRELGNECALADFTKKERIEAWDGIHAPPSDRFCEKISRTDPQLFQVIDELGIDVCACKNSKLKIIEIPDGVEIKIEPTHWREYIYEKSKIPRVWR